MILGSRVDEPESESRRAGHEREDGDGSSGGKGEGPECAFLLATGKRIKEARETKSD